MKTILRTLTLTIGLILFSCSPEDSTNEFNGNQSSADSKMTTTTSKIWNFNDLNEWTNASQSGSGNYLIESGELNLFTHPNTWERSKVKTISSFTAGIYNWRIYVPQMGVGDMASIGAFLYSDDTHELDFEIGYGTTSLRTQLAAEPDDLIVYMTSQANPYVSVRKKIKREQWYNLTIELNLNSKGQYMANWKINDISIANAQLNYGNKAKFNIFCSVENLQFIGDHIPQIQNYALFDFVEFKQN